MHEIVHVTVQFERDDPDERRGRCGITCCRRRSVPVTTRHLQLAAGRMKRSRLDGRGDEVRNADDARNNVDKRYGDLGTGDVTVDTALTWVLNDYVPTTTLLCITVSSVDCYVTR